MQRVLILGATSAVAGEVARLYAERGARLFLVGRNREALAARAAELGDAVVGAAAYDVRDHADSPRIVEEAVATLGGVDVALIAHGLLGDQLRTEADFDAALEVLDVNFLSVVAQVIPLANYFDTAGAGHLAVIASVAGLRGRPRNYTYGAAKGGLTVYLQGVRARLYPRVKVHTILLGPVDTPMTVDHAKNALFARPADAAARIVRTIERGVDEPFVPWFWRPIMAVVRHLPQRAFQQFKFLAGR